jgi:hypothetical protein
MLISLWSLASYRAESLLLPSAAAAEPAPPRSPNVAKHKFVYVHVGFFEEVALLITSITMMTAQDCHSEWVYGAHC